MSPERAPADHSRLHKVIGGVVIAGLLSVGGVIGVSTAVPPDVNENNHSSQPIPGLDGEYVKVFHIRGADGELEWPLAINPWGFDPPKPAGETFQQTQVQLEAAIEQAQIRNTHEGKITCPDGRVVPYSTYGTMPLKAIQQGVCYDDPKKVANVENTGKADKSEPPVAPPKKTIPPPSNGGTGGGSGGHSAPGKPHNTPSKPKPTGCMQYDNGNRILCVAQRFDGVFYRLGGGHISASAFERLCPDPRNPGDNHAHGAPRDWNNAGYSGNPSPCALDCSSLVSQTVNQAFHADYNWDVAAIKYSNAWKKIKLHKVRAGDVVTEGPDGHVEIVRYHRGDYVYTFGSHSTGTRTGKSMGILGNRVASYHTHYDSAYRYVGKGSK